MVAPAIIALGGSLLYGEHDVKTWLGQLRQTIVHLEGNGRKIGLRLVVGNLHEKGFNWLNTSSQTDINSMKLVLLQHD